MYSAVLLLHSVLRWAVIVAGLVAAGTGWREVPGWRSTRPGRVFTMLLDVQVLAGLILYVLLSPTTRSALQHFGATMSNDVLRFWAVEHPVAMIAGLALAHVGRARQRRGTDARQPRHGAVYFTVAIAIILLATPWPFLPYGRPLI